MRIVQITPGAGDNFYCENCLRDHAVVRALREAGHDALMVPLYLPAASDQPDADADAPIFFGGINVFLQQKLALFRRTPRWVDRLFDSDRLLRWAAGMAGVTRAKDLGETTLSMLRGEHGRQVKELNRLTAWLSAHGRADVVCLSNALLLGLNGRIRDRLRVPTVCLLQDEEPFLDALIEPYRREAWRMLRELAAGADAFVAVSHSYARTMQSRLGLPDDRLHVVYNGIDPRGYGPAETPPDPPAVGFLSQLCRGKGLDILVEAFVKLKSDPRLGGLKLRLSGGQTAADEPLLKQVRARLARAGVAGDVEMLDRFDRPAKQAFLRGLSVLSVPARDPEAFGLFVLESLACGVPVVLPRRGAFVELVEATGGGVLYEPNEPGVLAGVLGELLLDPPRARSMGRAGREAVLRDFHIERTARELAAVYQHVTGEAK